MAREMTPLVEPPLFVIVKAAVLLSVTSTGPKSLEGGVMARFAGRRLVPASAATASAEPASESVTVSVPAPPRPRCGEIVHVSGLVSSRR
jgi:hypothetical protein